MGGKEGGREGGRVRKEKAREKEKKENREREKGKLEKEKKKEKRERKESKDGNWKVHTLKQQNKKQCFHYELDRCGAITTFSKKAGRYLNPILQIRHGLNSPQNSNPNLIIYFLLKIFC